MNRSAEVLIEGDDKLHLRPMQALVEKALTFRAKVTATRGRKRADAKSIFDVMMLAVEKGPMTIRADGADATEAVEGLVAVLNAELNKG